MKHKAFQLHVAADPDAGVGARDVPVADAVSVANLDVIDRFGDRQVRCLGAANNRQSGGGAEEKGLKFHILTS